MSNINHLGSRYPPNRLSRVKSTHRWQVQNGCILLRGFRTSALHDLVLGFTPALLVLYEAESDTGHCYWLNQLFAQDLDLLNGLRKTVTLKVPMVRPINPSLWPQLAAEVRGVASALGRRIAVSGISLPILEATHTLMQSLHLIDLCANGSGAVIPLNELFNAELTAHKEIVTALVELDGYLKELPSSIYGVSEVAHDYVALCEKFAPQFREYVRQSPAGIEFQLIPELMAEHRQEAIRFVTQVVYKLTTLSLHGARAASEHGG